MLSASDDGDPVIIIPYKLNISAADRIRGIPSKLRGVSEQVLLQLTIRRVRVPKIVSIGALGSSQNGEFFRRLGRVLSRKIEWTGLKQTTYTTDDH